MRRLLLVAALASLTTAERSAAQSEAGTIQMVGVGMRVQVGVVEGPPQSSMAAPAQDLRGTVRAIVPETLYLDITSISRTVAIPRRSIESVRLSLGPLSRRDSAILDGMIGGAIVAVLLPSFVVQPERRFGSMDRATLAGAGIGFGAGALLGALRPIERWLVAWLPE